MKIELNLEHLINRPRRGIVISLTLPFLHCEGGRRSILGIVSTVL